MAVRYFFNGLRILFDSTTTPVDVDVGIGRIDFYGLLELRVALRKFLRIVERSAPLGTGRGERPIE